MLLMLAKPSTQLTMHTHPSAGVFNPLKFALSHEEEEEEGVTTAQLPLGHFETLTQTVRLEKHTTGLKHAEKSTE